VDAPYCVRRVTTCSEFDSTASFTRIATYVHSHSAQLSHPPTHWHAETCYLPGRGPSDSLYLTLREWPRLPFTARIERAPFHRARSASKKGTWPLPPILPSMRVPRAQRINQAATLPSTPPPPVALLPSGQGSTRLPGQLSMRVLRPAESIRLGPSSESSSQRIVY